MIQEDKNKTFRAKTNEVDQEGKRIPLLLESIFLRYFPVPFIKYLYEKQQNFLEVYRSDSYRSPILIWSKQLR
jgi:hypothetical protein